MDDSESQDMMEEVLRNNLKTQLRTMKMEDLEGILRTTINKSMGWNDFTSSILQKRFDAVDNFKKTLWRRAHFLEKQV